MRDRAQQLLVGEPRTTSWTDRIIAEVALPRGMCVARTEVTCAQWSSLMPDAIPARCTEPNLPVTAVSLRSALAFCNAASVAAGLPSCYDTAAIDHWSRVDPMSTAALPYRPASLQDCAGFQLPSASQWVVAARWLAPDIQPVVGGSHAERCERLPALLANTSCGERGLLPIRETQQTTRGVWDIYGNAAELTIDFEYPHDPGALRLGLFGVSATPVSEGGDYAPDPRSIAMGGSMWTDPAWATGLTGIAVSTAGDQAVGLRLVRLPRPTSNESGGTAPTRP